jgi:hypothetical protein
MSVETKAKGASKGEASAGEYFENALKSFEEAVQCALRLQNDSTKFWTSLAEKGTLPSEWQEKAREYAKQAIPATQENVEELLRLIEGNSRASLDFLQKAVEASDSRTIEEAQSRTRELWESSLQSLRANAQAVVQANAKAMSYWSRIVGQPGVS